MQYVTYPTFKELVVSDSKAVRNREEIDSIPVIDDVRFHLYNEIAKLRDPCGKERLRLDKKLLLIDQLLVDLNLRA